MTRVLLDTGILSDFINHRRGISDRIRGLLEQGTRVGTCIPVLAEIVAGIECGQSRERNMKALLLGLPVLRLWPFDEAAAFQYGAIFADLRKKGRPMQSIDIMVASVALRLGNCRVATTDSDLLAIEGLDVQIW